MAVRTLKPTSAGRRFQTILTFDEITKVRPEKSLVVTKKRTGGRNSLGPHHDPAHRRRSQAEDPAGRLPAREVRRAGRGRGDRVRSQPQRPDRAPALP